MPPPEELTPDHTLTSILKSTWWSPIGRGAYNEATKSNNELTIYGHRGYWVGKAPLDQSDDMSSSARAVRKWNEINPDIPSYLSIFGMIVPYLGNTPASDDQIAAKVVDIYRRTRNIILDACAKNNFLVYKCKVICIDVDVALRRGSTASDSFGTEGDSIENFFVSGSRAGKARTVSVVRTLLYLQKYLAAGDIKDEYINLEFIEKLHVLRLSKIVLTPDIMSRLSEIIRSDSASRLTDRRLIELVTRERPSPLCGRHSCGFFSTGFYQGALVASVAAMILVPIALKCSDMQFKGPSA